MKKKRACKHCNDDISHLRINAKFCSETCRKLHHKLVTVENKKPSKNAGRTVPNNSSKSGDGFRSFGRDLKCKSCNKLLPKKNKNYCDRQCWKNFTDLNKLNNYHRSGFLKWWLGQFKRYWCLGVLHNPDGTKQTSEDLFKLYEVYKCRNKANGSGLLRIKKWQLCHLDPAKGSQSKYGLLHYDNLRIGDGKVNASLKNQEFGFDLSAVAVTNMLKPNSFTDGQLIHILNHYLDGAVLNMLLKRPSMVARNPDDIRSLNIEPSSAQQVFEMNLRLSNKEPIDYGYFDENVRFNFHCSPEQMQLHLFTNTLEEQRQ